MKTSLILTCALSFGVLSAFAQEVENDDMYFNSKDRAKLRELRANENAVAYSSAKPSRSEVSEEEVNPTDSYSARNTNPEFSARSNAQSVQEDNQDYFLPDYKFQTAQNFNSWNNDFNRWYGNRWYSPSYYSPGIYGWNSPYYGSYYDSWGNPWNNPYYQSGWSSSFSYHWGNNWNYGWGLGYNYGCPYNSWGSSYGYASSWYSPYSPYGYRYSPWGNGYPRVVVVESSDNYNYSKRGSRSSYISRTQPGVNNRVAAGYTTSGTGSRSTSGGRESGAGRTNPEYYNRTWRNQHATTSPSSTNGSTTGQTRTSSWSNGSTNTNSSYNRSNGSDWNNTNRSSYNRSNSNSNNSSYTPSRSSSGYDGGSRSSGSSGTSGSGSRSSRGSRGGN